MGKMPFSLIEDEKIVADIKPLPKAKWYWFICNYVGILLVCFSVIDLVVILIILIIAGEGALGFAASTATLVGLSVLTIINWWYSSWRYKWEHYWITNKRVIQQSGFIGHEIRVVPLERISDVVVTRSFVEKLLGFGSLHLQTLAGQVTTGQRYGAEIFLVAVPDPEATQQLILKLIEEKRKRERLTF